MIPMKYGEQYVHVMARVIPTRQMRIFRERLESTSTERRTLYVASRREKNDGGLDLGLSRQQRADLMYEVRIESGRHRRCALLTHEYVISMANITN